MTFARRADLETRVLVVLGVVGLLAVAYFDVQTNLAFLDEYGRRWTVQQLVAGHGFQYWGRSSDLVQVMLAAIPAVFRLDPGFWRWVEIPFLGLHGVLSALIAMRLGATRFWAAIGGACLACNPLNLWLATGMMTETVFVALFMASIWFALAWESSDRAVALAVVFAILATLQRQQGAALPLAMSVLLLLSRRRRPLTRRDLVGLAAMWIGCLGALGLSELLTRSTVATVRAAGPTASHLFGFAFWIYGVASLMPLLGLFLLPLLGALLLRPRLSGSPFPGVIAVVLAVLGLGFAWLISLPQRGSVFPGNILNSLGLGPPFLSGKPALLPGWAFLALGVGASLTFAALFLWRQDWRWSHLDDPRRLLVLNAAVQFIFIFYQGQVFDRYYLVIVACLVPVVAATIGGSVPWAARYWGIGAVAIGLTFYVAGEQDYQAWQVARDRAARIAYQQAPPWEVAAGWEAEAQYVWIPARVDRSNTLPGVVSAHPLLKLIFVPADDPRPGVAYRSLAPGKLVIVPAGDGPIAH